MKVFDKNHYYKLLDPSFYNIFSFEPVDNTCRPFRINSAFNLK